MEEKKKSMTKDEMIMELMELLKANGRPKQAADVFEIYMKENKGKIKPEMKEVAVQKNEKAR